MEKLIKDDEGKQFIYKNRPRKSRSVCFYDYYYFIIAL